MSENQADNGIFERAKQRDFLEVAREFGFELTREANGDYRCTSFFAPDNNQTCVCYSPSKCLWHDWKADNADQEISGGTVIEFVMLMKNCSAFEAAKFLTGEEFFNPEQQKERKKYLSYLEKKYLKAHENLKNFPEVINYLHERKITDETIEEYKIGVHETKEGEKRLSIPYFDENNKICYGVTRSLEKFGYAILNEKGEPKQKYKKEYLPEGMQQPLMFLNTIKRKKDLLFIGEGVFDEMSIAQEGYSTLCYVGANAGEKNLPVVTNYARQFDRIILCFDNDFASKVNTGKNFTLKTAFYLIKSGITNFDVILNYGEGVKDVSDYYAKGGLISDLKEHTENGVNFLTRNFLKERPLKGFISKNKKEQNEEELKKFFKDVEIALKNDDEQLENVKKLFVDTYGKRTADRLAKPPSESETVREKALEFISEFEPKSFGVPTHREYYLYQGDETGMWRNFNQGDIWHSLIEKFNCDNVFARKIENEVYARSKKPDDEVISFGTPNKLNLRNGVLDLKTGEILAHEAKYYFNYVLDVPYNKTAQCPKFERFLIEFANFNKGRLQTIRDMLGYIFVFGNKEHAVFDLIGKGRNGKGVLLHILQKLLKDYAKEIHPNELQRANKRIEVKHALLITANEVNSEVSLESCEHIKKIAAGDLINGEEKYKNSQNFYPHATQIYCFNKTPKYADNSFGMRERQVYIKCEFCARGKEKNSLADTLIEEELAGIFNYILECTKDFVKNGCMVRRYEPDQRELEKEVATENSIVAEFMTEKYSAYKELKTVDKKKVYNEFKEFLDGIHYRYNYPTQYKFSRELKNLYPELTDKKETGNIYVWCFKTDEHEAQQENKKTVELDEAHFEVDEEVKEAKNTEFILDERTQKIKAICEKHNMLKIFEGAQQLYQKNEVNEDEVIERVEAVIRNKKNVHKNTEADEKLLEELKTVKLTA